MTAQVLGTPVCHANATCTDLDPKVANGEKFSCACANYYEGDGTVNGTGCSDINECNTNNGGCGDPTYFSCTNNIGEAPTCDDIDECATNNGGCGSATYWTCTNNVGGAPTCTDINECLTNNGGCGGGDSAKATCTNRDNGRDCACKAGYSDDNGDGTVCSDIDECATNPCANGTCTNLINSYSCACDAGWQGTNCDEDIIDCVSPDPCLPAGTCVEGTNGYTCSCASGYTYGAAGNEPVSSAYASTTYGSTNKFQSVRQQYFDSLRRINTMIMITILCPIRSQHETPIR